MCCADTRRRQGAVLVLLCVCLVASASASYSEAGAAPPAAEVKGHNEDAACEGAAGQCPGRDTAERPEEAGSKSFLHVAGPLVDWLTENIGTRVEDLARRAADVVGFEAHFEPGHMMEAVYSAAEKSQVELVRVLHELRVEAANKDGATAVYMAAQKGRAEMAKVLHELGVRLDETRGLVMVRIFGFEIEPSSERARLIVKWLSTRPWGLIIWAFWLLCIYLGSWTMLRLPVLVVISVGLAIEFQLYWVVRTFIAALELFPKIRLLHWALPLPVPRLRWSGKRRRLTESMRLAKDYEAWSEYAVEMDKLHGREDWKAQPESKEYHWKIVKAAIHRLKRARKQGDVARVIATLQPCMVKNFGGTMNTPLYAQTHVGTKHLVEELTHEMTSCIEWLMALKDPSDTAAAAAAGGGGGRGGRGGGGGGGRGSRRKATGGAASEEDQEGDGEAEADQEKDDEEEAEEEREAPPPTPRRSSRLSSTATPAAGPVRGGKPKAKAKAKPKAKGSKKNVALSSANKPGGGSKERAKRTNASGRRERSRSASEEDDYSYLTIPGVGGEGGEDPMEAWCKRHIYKGGESEIDMKFSRPEPLGVAEPVNVSLTPGLREMRAEFFKNAKRSYGNTALLMSGGATLGLYHIGMMRALSNAHCFPRVISGTSAGAVLAGYMAVRTDDEINACLNDPEFVHWFKQFGSHGPFYGSWLWKLRQLLSSPTGTIYDWADRDGVRGFMRHLDWFCGQDITFAEAYARTGRLVNITCTPKKTQIKGSPPLILNHLTAPNVTLASAVCASSCVPMLIPPVPLLEKCPKSGKIRPWETHVSSTTGEVGDAEAEEDEMEEVSMEHIKMRDGSFESDVPVQAIAELFNCSFSIVSQCNPHVIPFFYHARGADGRPVTWRLWAGGWRGGFVLSALELWLKEDMLKNLRVLAGLDLLIEVFGVDWSYLWLQEARGDVTILPEMKFTDYMEIISNLPNVEALHRRVNTMEKKTWECMSRIRCRMSVQRALDRACETLGIAEF